jgi:hypothetical protein
MHDVTSLFTCRLSFNLISEKLGKITNDKWVLSVIRNGLMLDFIEIPNFSGMKQTCAPSGQMKIIIAEVQNLLQKGAIEKVPPHLGSQKDWRIEACNKFKTAK